MRYVSGSKYGLSNNGWINTDLSKRWFYKLFLSNAIKDRPLLLSLDEHSTHYQPDIINVAKEHDVIVLCLQTILLSHQIVEFFHHLKLNRKQHATTSFKKSRKDYYKV